MNQPTTSRRQTRARFILGAGCRWPLTVPIARFYRPVHELPLEVARKIAAGEVIDRPAAVIRELIDNAIDAGSTKITVEIAGGGIESIRITDNGCGMTAEDLAICTHTHTTSKISSEDDLLSLATLGFRGEALSSIHAVSRLEITTTRDGREAWKLEFGHVVPSRLSVGTIVSIEGLFENFPARRQFLKRASAETALCKQIFTEKALAWPEIEFRFSVDGKQGEILPRVSTLRERCLAALSPRESESFFLRDNGSRQAVLLFPPFSAAPTSCARTGDNSWCLSTVAGSWTIPFFRRWSTVQKATSRTVDIPSVRFSSPSIRLLSTSIYIRQNAKRASATNPPCTMR